MRSPRIIDQFWWTSPLGNDHIAPDGGSVPPSRRPTRTKANGSLRMDGVQASPPWTDDAPLKTANSYLSRVMQGAAGAAIPRGARKEPKPWWNDDVEAAVRRRNTLPTLARTDPTQGAAWT